MNTSKRLSSRTPCTLQADCIKLTGRGAVDLIKVINFSKEGMGLISNKALDIGSYQIIHVLENQSIKDPDVRGSIRTVGVVEVRWIKEIEDKKFSEFRTGVKYLFNP